MDTRQGAVAVTGLGMASSLGGVVTACAAARAGIQRVGPLPEVHVHDLDLFGSVPVQGHGAWGITEGFQGMGRLLRLCSEALIDFFSYSGLEQDFVGKTGLFLNLSSDFFRQCIEMEERASFTRSQLPLSPLPEHETRREGLRQHLLGRLCALNGVAFHPRYQRVYFEGQAGVIRAVDEAVTLLLERKLDACIVGGVDSYLDPDVLRALHQLRVLKVPDNPVGFMPGEAAAFVLLERADQATRRGASIEALIGSPELGVEETANMASQLKKHVAQLKASKYHDNGGCVVADDKCKYRENGYSITKNARAKFYNLPRYDPARIRKLKTGKSLASSGRFSISLASGATMKFSDPVRPDKTNQDVWDVDKYDNFNPANQGKGGAIGKYPYEHQWHHMIPSNVLVNQLYDKVHEYKLLELLMHGKYNLNGERNMLLLPVKANVSEIIDWPRHCGRHPSYDAYVKGKLAWLKRQLSMLLGRERPSISDSRTTLNDSPTSHDRERGIQLAYSACTTQ